MTASQRLILIARSTPMHHPAGGMERIAWTLAEELSKTRSVEYVTTELRKDLSRSEDEFELFALRGTPPGRYSLAWWFRSWRFFSPRVARNRRRATTLLSVSTGGASAFIFRSGFLKVLQAHGTALAELKGRVPLQRAFDAVRVLRLLLWIPIDCLIYLRSTAIIAVSDTVDAALHEVPYSWFTRNRVHLIYNGVDEFKFKYNVSSRLRVRKELEIDPQQLVVLGAGRLVSQKGFDRLVHSIVNQPNLLLLVVGEGPERTTLEELAKTLGVFDRVRFLGPIDNDSIPLVLSASDLLAFPARNIGREGLPTVVLEALASGLPVVSSIGGPWPRALQHAITEADPTQPTIFGQLMFRAANDRIGRRESHLPRQFTLSGMVAGYSQVLDGICHE